MLGRIDHPFPARIALIDRVGPRRSGGERQGIGDLVGDDRPGLAVQADDEGIASGVGIGRSRRQNDRRVDRGHGVYEVQAIAAQHAVRGIAVGDIGGAGRPLAAEGPVDAQVMERAGEPVAGRQFRPIVFAPRDHVDDAGDGVRAVLGRTAIGNDVGHHQAARRNDVHVGRGRGDAHADDAMSVHHYQRGRAASSIRTRQAAQVRAVDHQGVPRKVGRHLEGVERGRELRQLLGKLRRALDPGAADVVLGDPHDIRTGRRNAADQGSGNDDLFLVGPRKRAFRGGILGAVLRPGRTRKAGER